MGRPFRRYDGELASFVRSRTPARGIPTARVIRTSSLVVTRDVRVLPRGYSPTAVELHAEMVEARRLARAAERSKARATAKQTRVGRVPRDVRPDVVRLRDIVGTIKMGDVD